MTRALVKATPPPLAPAEAREWRTEDDVLLYAEVYMANPGITAKEAAAVLGWSVRHVEDIRATPEWRAIRREMLNIARDSLLSSLATRMPEVMTANYNIAVSTQVPPRDAVAAQRVFTDMFRIVVEAETAGAAPRVSGGIHLHFSEVPPEISIREGMAPDIIEGEYTSP